MHISSPISPPQEYSELEWTLRAILEDLALQDEEETEPLWAFAGFLVGLVASLGLLFCLGKVGGLSGPGINSGLAALGALAGGGMVLGLCLLLAHASAWAVAAYFLARRKNRAHAARALAVALAGLEQLRLALRAAPYPHRAQIYFLDLLIDCLRLKQNPAAAARRIKERVAAKAPLPVLGMDFQ